MTIDTPTSADLGPMGHGAAADALLDATKAQSKLAQAHLLLAETRFKCEETLQAAIQEADDIVTNARGIAWRILADAQAQVTGEDLRPRSAFSRLWDESAPGDASSVFFQDLIDREPEEIFNP